MVNNVLISRTDIDGDNVVLYYRIPSLNVDARTAITSTEFQEQVSKGGFTQLGTYLIGVLAKGLQDMLGDD